MDHELEGLSKQQSNGATRQRERLDRSIYNQYTVNHTYDTFLILFPHQSKYKRYSTNKSLPLSTRQRLSLLLQLVNIISFHTPHIHPHLRTIVETSHSFVEWHNRIDSISCMGKVLWMLVPRRVATVQSETCHP